MGLVPSCRSVLYQVGCRRDAACLNPIHDMELVIDVVQVEINRSP